MRIIGLYGHGDCGKSETLNALKELQSAAGKPISAEPHPWSDMPVAIMKKDIRVDFVPSKSIYSRHPFFRCSNEGGVYRKRGDRSLEY